MNNWILRKTDINNAFLNGHLTEAVYMEQPIGFVNPSKATYVSKLYKALSQKHYSSFKELIIMFYFSWCMLMTSLSQSPVPF